MSLRALCCGDVNWIRMTTSNFCGSDGGDELLGYITTWNFLSR